MQNQYINNGTVIMMGENNTSNGTTIGQQNSSIMPDDWDRIRSEINVILNKLPTLNADLKDNLETAVQKKNPKMLTVALQAAHITRDFLISLGASLLANRIQL